MFFFPDRSIFRPVSPTQPPRRRLRPPPLFYHPCLPPQDSAFSTVPYCPQHRLSRRVCLVASRRLHGIPSASLGTSTSISLYRTLCRLFVSSSEQGSHSRLCIA